jgi:hypothetical protein
MLLVLPNELDILRNMRPLDRDVFNYLAERVDFESGIVGESRRVSYGGMALDLSERDVARRVKCTLVKVTSKTVENAINRLVNIGLLSRLSMRGFKQDLILIRVFWVELLSTDNSVQNPVGSSVGFKLGVIIKKIYNSNNYIQDNNNLSCGLVGSSVGITSIQHTTTRAREDDKFTMSLEWQPDQQDLEKILSMYGFVVGDVNKTWINEFISFWFSEGERALSQRQWTAKLARLLVDYLAHPGLFEQRHGIGKPIESPGFKNLALPEWARMPRDDMRLVAWMRHFGYGDPPAGLDYKQARSFLQRQVDIRLNEWKRGLS